MKKLVGITGVVICSVVLIAWQRAPAPLAPRKDLTWAFPAIDPNQPKLSEDGRPKRIPESDKGYSQAQIDDHFNPPDWFPNEHPRWPKSVQFGNPPIAQACSSCHLSNGLGHPESANLTGLNAAFMIRQMADFKNDARKNSEPMNAFAKNLSEKDARE